MKIPYPSQCCSSSTCDAENWEISDISGQKQKLNGDSALSYFQFPLFPFAAGVGYLSPEICGGGLELGHRKQCKSLEFSFHSTPAHSTQAAALVEYKAWRPSSINFQGVSAEVPVF